MILRWRKNKKKSGLSAVGSAPRGSTLYFDGDIRVATVSSTGTETDKWYWVAGWDHPNIPHKNTSENPVEFEMEAKLAALKYVRNILNV